MRRHFLRQRGSLARRAVGDDDARRAGPRDGCQRTARGAAGAQQQHALAFQGQTQIDFDVAHQPDAVEVARLDAFAFEAQRVGGAGQACVVAGLVGGGQRLQLEGQRDVEPQAASGAERGQRTHEAAIIRTAVNGFVCHVLLRGLREQPVNQRRLAVGDGVADDGVAVGHGAGG